MVGSADIVDAVGALAARVSLGASWPARRVTERERQILVLISDGLTNAQIANRLGISPTMLIWSTRTNVAVFLVFLTLELTEIVLFIGFLGGGSGMITLGGYLGIVTALVAWYTSAAGVVNSMSPTPVLPVGKPLWAGAGVVTASRRAAGA